MNYNALLIFAILMAATSFGNDVKLNKKTNTEAAQVFPNIKPYPDQAELSTKNKPMELENQADLTSLLPEAGEKQIGIPTKEKPYLAETMKSQQAPIKEKTDLNVKKKQSETPEKVLAFPYHEEISTDVLPKIDPYLEEPKK